MYILGEEKILQKAQKLQQVKNRESPEVAYTGHVFWERGLAFQFSLCGLDLR